MNYDKTIEYLRAADAVSSAEMYVFTRDTNREMVFGFRLWEGLKNMAEDDAKRLVDEMNDATKPVREAWEKYYKIKAEQSF